jgi:hypothetical protein
MPNALKRGRKFLDGSRKHAAKPATLPVNDTQPERGGFETWWQSIGFPARSYCVYVLRDAEHQVLYAGKTSDDCLRSRTSNQYTNKPWIEEVAHIDIPLSGYLRKLHCTKSSGGIITESLGLSTGCGSGSLGLLGVNIITCIHELPVRGLLGNWACSKRDSRIPAFHSLGLLGNSRVYLLSATVLEVFVLFCPKGYGNVIWISDVDQKEW